jgi:chromate transporter
LITFALLKLLSATLLAGGSINYLNTGLYLVFVALVLVFKKAHPLVWILLGAAIGLILRLPS